jgi:type IV pilus assembly protein PilA
VRPSARSTYRGFTLVELMVVVAMVGILATLAVFGVKKYLNSSKSSEAIQMIGSIKAAQESYRSETFSYLDVSGAHALSQSTFYPTASPGTQSVQWGATGTAQGVNWQSLGVTADAPVRFAYGCAAGGSSDAVPAPLKNFTPTGWPGASTQPWYVVEALGDLDADGTYSNFVSSSFVGQIFIDKESE